MEGLIIAAGAGTVVAVDNALAPKLRLPVPSTQVLLGFALVFVLGLGSPHMPPEVVLLLFLPDLLFWESLTTSKNAIRRDLRGILVTSTVFVVATAFVVARIVSLLRVPWEVASIPGVAVAPPNATATAALAKGLPRRQFMLLKAENLINDGTALAVYTIAVGLMLGGQYTLWGIIHMAVVSLPGEVPIGIIVAAVAYLAFRRLREPIIINMVLLVALYAACLATELVHASGVLAAVVVDLIISTLPNQLNIPESRVQAEHSRPLVTSLPSDALFPLIGIETRLPAVNFSFSEPLTLVGITVDAAVTLMVSHFVLLQIIVTIICAFDRRPEQWQRRLSYRARVVNATSTFHGGVPLMITLSIPLTMKDGPPFPYRDEVVSVVALATMIGTAVQGSLLPKVIAQIVEGGHTSDNEEAELTEEQLTTGGRLVILEAVRPELPVLAKRAGVPSRAAETMEGRLDDIVAHIGVDDGGEDIAEIVALERLRGAVLRRKWELLGQFAWERRISDETARILRAYMGLEEVHRNSYFPYE